MKQYKRSIFIFRRDLRLADNTALREAFRRSQEVVPCFIFDPRQVGSKNRYKSERALQFMIESLYDLEKAVAQRGGRLYFFYGDPHDVVATLQDELACDALFINADYTPFSTERDESLRMLCARRDMEFVLTHDLLLHAPGTIMTSTGSAYQQFTPYYEKASKRAVAQPEPLEHGVWYTGHVAAAGTIDPQRFIKSYYANQAVKGGTEAALALLLDAGRLATYEHEHNMLMFKTSMLSAHLKFGTLSVRQVYWAWKKMLSNPEALIRQLYWRDFFTMIGAQYPRVFGQAFHEQYDHTWRHDTVAFKRWCEGKTGVPVVDAGMRQLLKTGFMHNRARLLTASYLVKNLGIDWRLGERFFAQHLIDYDPAVNNGNWQWVASTGASAQSPFRVFNPSVQQKKYDPRGEYVSLWLDD